MSAEVPSLTSAQAEMAREALMEAAALDEAVAAFAETLTRMAHVLEPLYTAELDQIDDPDEQADYIAANLPANLNDLLWRYASNITFRLRDHVAGDPAKLFAVGARAIDFADMLARADT